MLVDEGRERKVVRAWAWVCWLSLAALVVATVSIAPHFKNSMELVRMRNALLLQSDPGTRFDWTPAAVPGDFLLERERADPRFAAVINELRLASMPSDWARALAIGDHLLAKASSGSGGAIQSDLNTTYRRIVQEGQGYCGDFVDVFTGLALAAGIPTRTWAFSFDGFGGHGHIFNEIWDRDARAWRMIDVFNNAYFVLAQGAPLSALEFRAALERNAPDLRMVPVSSRAPPRYKHEAKAWEYYRKGLNEWYAWWGNNVFTYDRSPFVRTLGSVNRSLEQLGGIAAGVHPGIRVLDDVDNRAQVQSMEQLRVKLLAALLFGVLALIAAVGWAVARWRMARR